METTLTQVRRKKRLSGSLTHCRYVALGSGFHEWSFSTWL